MITLNQTHSKTFHCTYLLHNYPFDTQVCPISYKLLREILEASIDLSLSLLLSFTILVVLDIFHLSYYQVCRVNLQLQKFDQKNVELVPDTIDLLTDTELTQYYIQSWSLEQRNIGRLRMMKI